MRNLQLCNSRLRVFLWSFLITAFLTGSVYSSQAQTQLYFNSFNTNLEDTEWALNTADLGCDGNALSDNNYFIIDTDYAGGPLTIGGGILNVGTVVNTPFEVAGIEGYPASAYLHITNGINGETSAYLDQGYFNANFLAPATGNIFAKMNIPVVTTGYDSVTLTFWYLCVGGASDYSATLYYSTNGGTAWAAELSFTSIYNVSGWIQATITNAAYNNVADLRFAFMWNQGNGNTATDPSIAVDDIKVTGSAISTCPITINSQTGNNPSCHDSVNGAIIIAASGDTNLVYTINSGTPLANSTGSFANLSPGVYTVKVGDGACSVSGSSITLSNPPSVPVPTASNSGPICAGNTIQLFATTVTGAAYQWTGPNNNSFNTQSPSITNATSADSGVYTVIAIIAGCSSAPAATLAVITPGPAAPTISNNGPLCAGDTLKLTASNVSGATYIWTTPDNHQYNIQNLVIPAATTSDSGLFTLTASISGCASPVSTNVVVYPAPASPALTATDTAFCAYDSTRICATAGFASYVWNIGDATTCITTNQQGNYYVTVTNSDGCAAVSNHLFITVYQLFAVSISQSGNILTAHDEISYQWYRNDTLIPGATDSVLVCTAPGNYTVAVTNADGCQLVSSEIIISGLNDLTGNEGFELYPNPVSDGNLQLLVSESWLGSMVEICDVTGRLLISSKIERMKERFNVNLFQSGVYLIRSKGIIKKFIKE